MNYAEKQRETLREISDRPHATQAELAERLGVTSATISQRVNGIDGFDWSDQQSFVERFFDREESEGDASDDGATATADDRPADTPAPPDGSDSGSAELESRSERADTALGDGGNADGTRNRQAGDADSRSSAESAAMSDDRDNEVPSAVGRPESEPNSMVGATDAPKTGTTLRGHPDVAIADRIDELTARVESIERQLTADQSVDPELARKVLRACFESDQISADEEIAVVEGILEADNPPTTALVDPSDH